MASLDPVAYLRATPPFSALPQPLFDRGGRVARGGLLPAGTWLVRVGAGPLQHLYVIRKGSVRLEREGQTLQVLEEGETFGYTSLLTGKATLDVAVEDDLLAYRVPGDEFQRLLTDATFAGHFAVGLSARLELQPGALAGYHLPADLSVEVQQLLRRPAGLGRRRPPPWRGRPGDARPAHLLGAGAHRPARHRHRPRLPQPGARRGARAGDPGPRRPLAPAPDGGRGHAHLGGLEPAPRLRGHHLPGRRGDEIAACSPPPTSSAPRPRAGGGAAPGGAAQPACRAARLRRQGDRDGRGAAGRRPRRRGHRRLRGPAQRRPGAPPAGLRRGRPRPAAGALRLDRPRLGGAHGADPPHRPGQRPRLRRRGGAAARLVPGARRATSTATSRRPASRRCPGGYMATEVARDGLRVGAALRRLVRGAASRRSCWRPPPSSTSAGSAASSTSSRSRR